MSKPTVAEYAVDRLSKLGITDCFGIPGDYAFPINDAIASHDKVQWRGCSNELNASYAADGYARIRGGIDAVHNLRGRRVECAVRGDGSQGRAIDHLSTK